MKEFDKINTQLPYKESPEYVEKLVARCKEEALKQSAPARKNSRSWTYGFIGLAAAALVGLGIFLFSPESSSDKVLLAGPIDIFLESISDEEAAMINDFTIEDIPEYYL